MQRALSSFDQALKRVRELEGLFLAVKSLTTDAVDPSDLLRSQIVLAVSALDHLVHELTVAGMLEVFDGVRSPTAAYGKFNVPMVKLTVGPNARLTRTGFEAAVRYRHGFLTFQRPEKIADAIRLFCPIILWDAVAINLGTNARQLKVRIDLAVDRRNKISHEADMDPSYPGSRWPITEQDARDVEALIDDVGHAIYQVCK